MPPTVRQGLVLLGPRSSHEPTDITTAPVAPFVSKWPQVGSLEFGTPLPSPQLGSSRSNVSVGVASSRIAESAMCSVIWSELSWTPDVTRTRKVGFADCVYCRLMNSTSEPLRRMVAGLGSETKEP